MQNRKTLKEDGERRDMCRGMTIALFGIDFDNALEWWLEKENLSCISCEKRKGKSNELLKTLVFNVKLMS